RGCWASPLFPPPRGSGIRRTQIQRCLARREPSHNVERPGAFECPYRRSPRRVQARSRRLRAQNQQLRSDNEQLERDKAALRALGSSAAQQILDVLDIAKTAMDRQEALVGRMDDLWTYTNRLFADYEVNVGVIENIRLVLVNGVSVKESREVMIVK